MNTEHVELTNQWNDFELRKLDPYAQAKYEILLSWLGPVKGLSTLVVGSGSGEFACMLAERGARVTAVDISQEALDLVAQCAREWGVEVEALVVSKLEDLQLQKRFDLVFATDVIEHIEDDQLALLRLRESIKSEGRLIITVPAFQWLFGYHDEVLGHFRRYSKSPLGPLLKDQFTILRWRYFGFLLIPVTLLISRWWRKPYPVRAAGEAMQKRSLFGFALRLVFAIEKRIPTFAGTSLLLMAKPKTITRPA